VVIDLIKRLGNIKSADARCTTLTNNVINNTTNSANSKITANAFLKSKLVIRGSEERLKTIKDVVFKGFGQNGTCDTPKVIASHGLTIAIFNFFNFFRVKIEKL